MSKIVSSSLFIFIATFLVGILIFHAERSYSANHKGDTITKGLFDYRLNTLKSAINDLMQTNGDRYPNGSSYLDRLKAIRSESNRSLDERVKELHQLQKEALLANPLLDFDQIILVRRQVKDNKPTRYGYPSNHECNSSLQRLGYDNEIAFLSIHHPEKKYHTLYKPENSGYVGEVDLHWDAKHLLFSQSDKDDWDVWEIKLDGSNLRQVSHTPNDVDCFDACYTPEGKIVFGSTASYQSVPCWHGQRHVSNLYVMNADGKEMRQLCFDQDHNFHPSVMPDGQILYHRWDYTGINHIFFRQLMLMRPDGTGQRAIYGSNSWFPNSLYFPRGIPGHPEKIICILSGYHGVHRMGQLVLIDINKGWHASDGLVKRISGKGDPIQPKIKDELVDHDWPKFLTPYPINDKYFLVACQPDAQSPWGIYLADVFDNLVLIKEEPGYALLEPIPVKERIIPPVIPNRVRPGQTEGTVFLQDVYAGGGLEGVPRGTIKSLRVLAYHFGYRGLAGPHKIGYSGPWEAMRILGTVPVEEDGSAVFKAPANTALSVQPLDQDGQAVQLMRSWFTLMPGESLSCVGCHEEPGHAPLAGNARAGIKEPHTITEWYGPARGFDFEREVQPVLTRYCVGCHNGQSDAPLDLRAEKHFPDYRGKLLSTLGVKRLHPKMKEDTQGYNKYTPAYDALLPYIRRVAIEDDVSMLTPGEYMANTSELIQMLRKGHQGIELDDEAWDRLITWIDLNGPCHGTWGDVYPVPENADKRRMELQKMYGGPGVDFEVIPAIHHDPKPKVKPKSLPPKKPLEGDGWPFDSEEVKRLQQQYKPLEMIIDLGDGVKLELIRIPHGQSMVGDLEGEADRTKSFKPIWMAKHEITNRQYRLFDKNHDSGYYTKRHARSDDKGLTLNDPDQPVVRVSWKQAMAFCQWLSKKTGKHFSLPTESQWENACRAGSDTPLFYGDVDTDFSKWGNLADESFSRGYRKDGLQVTGGVEHLVLEGASLSDARFNDGAIVTTPVGSYQPNPFGLFDMHGNAAEWMLNSYQKSPESESSKEPMKCEVRGGSFFDRPERCISSFRLNYPRWQRVFNVGFRVVCLSD